jgi:AraC-like DNA-binding protein
MNDRVEKRCGAGERVSTLISPTRLQVIRSWLEDSAREDHGWLAALRDEHIGRAVAALHRAPGDDWTLAGLARVAGMSRSVFAQRFSDLVGEPAMTYVTWFRMETACVRLRDTDEPLATVAEGLGYRSEAAFGRSFKRIIGTSPARFRKSSRAASL